MLENKLPKWWLALAGLTLAVCPLAVSLPLPFMAKRALNVSPFDPLVWLSAVSLFVLMFVKNRDALKAYIGKWAWACWPGMLLVLFMLTSLLGIDSWSKKTILLSGKSVFQAVEYLLVAPFVFVVLFEGYIKKKNWKSVCLIFWGMAVCLIANFFLTAQDGAVYQVSLIAAVLFFLLRGVDGLYENNPCPVATFWIRFSTGFFFLVTLYFGIFVFPLPVIIAFCVCCCFLVCAAINASMNNKKKRSLPAVLLYSLFCVIGIILLLFSGRASELEGKFAFFHDFKKPGAIVSEPRLSMRIYRWQANLNMIEANRVFGVGAGQYQRNLKEYYGSVDVPDARTDRKDLYDIETHEPFSFGWFFVTACETGLPGLMAVFIFLGQLLVRSAGFNGRKCILASGVMACFVLLLMTGLWTSPMVRGAGPLLGLLLAVSAVKRRGKEEQEVDCCD